VTFQGTVQNGVIILEGGACLPDGTTVTIVPSLGNQLRDESETSTIGKELAELGRWAEMQTCNLPSDLAKNHDHYLHGLPKRS
jgi:hypothetical protein